MIVVDTSALIAILNNEDDAAQFAAAISEADSPLLSAASMVETCIVMLRRHGTRGVEHTETLIRKSGLSVESVTVRQAHLAVEAYAKYGKGRRKDAALNFGDCLSYALAKTTGLSLLYKGNDFAKTDIRSVL